MSNPFNRKAAYITTAGRETAAMHPEAVQVPRRFRRMVTAAVAAMAGMMALAPAVSVAAPSPAPAWAISDMATPTNFTPGTTAHLGYPVYYLQVRNAGAATTSGTVTITDTVPAGVKPVEAWAFDAEENLFWCPVSGQTVTCTNSTPVQPGRELEVEINVEVPAASSGTVIDRATVSGGGAAEASTSTETTIIPSYASFGFTPGPAGFSASMNEADGTATTQAGVHPYALTVTAGFPSAVRNENLNGYFNAHDVHVDLPHGVVVNPRATPVRCTEAELETDLSGSGCPLASQVGVVAVTYSPGYPATPYAALYNMVPPAGKPAEFGFDVAKAGFYVHLMGGVDAGAGYALSASSNDILAKLPILGVRVTLWGDPSDPSHGYELGGCAYRAVGLSCPQSIPATATPFLTAPTSCTTPLSLTAIADSWQELGKFASGSAALGDLDNNPLSLSGCSKLDFTPSISVTPGSSSADSPTGLQVDLKVPQTESFNTFATANLMDATVTLPAGMTVNPSAANGMAVCPLLTGKEGQPGVTGIDLEDGEAAKCPNGSKIGSIEVTTPLLDHPLPGAIYIAAQNDNPFKSLLAIYLAVHDPQTGVVIKLAGHVEANPVTGQLTTTFDENPQLPFEDMKLSFFGGERAALTTPATCGQYAASASFASWAQPESTVSPFVQPFTLTSGPGASACSAPGFAPSFVAGTSTNQAAGYSPFVMTLNRKDGEQRLGSVAFKMPPGLVGMISHVTPCAEAEANAGTCPSASQIGHVSVAAGVGGKPETLPQPGRQEDPVYLTEGYEGAPFGIAVVVHAEAGPFNLGTVVVRGTIDVDPHTAQVSIATDPSSPHAMPTILQGIPVDVQSIDIEVNKAEFMLNPTSCEPLSVSGTIGSSEGASAAVSSRFQAAGCRGLAFHPKFSALIHKHHSRKNGEYLHVVVKSGAGEANIGKVHVSLPKRLPSRLSTLKQACPEAQFDASPAGCDAGSVVGHATAYTPVLPVPMEGSVYFVSHGGAKYPELVAVLQGDGVTVQLNGETMIAKGITKSTFGSVPDVPISRFDMVLPSGPHSALTGLGNMCRKQLRMPTRIVGQNGAVIKRSTKIVVAGCKKSKAAGARRHHKRHGHHSHASRALRSRK